MKSAIFLSLVAGLFLLSCSGPVPMPEKPEKTDIIDAAAGAGSFKTLLGLLRQADLDLTLRGPGPYTVLAPTDEAFTRVSPETLDSLLKPGSREKLRRLLTYHLVPGTLLAEDLILRSRLPTVSGLYLSVRQEQDDILLDEARLIQADIRTDNGVIHVIDAVLTPPFEELPE